MTNPYDYSKYSSYTHVICNAQYYTDLSFDKARKTVSLRQIVTIPLIGKYISWIIFKLSSTATIAQATKDLTLFIDEQLSEGCKQTAKAVDELFQQCRPSFSEDLLQLATLRCNIQYLSLTRPNNGPLADHTVLLTDNLKDRIIKELKNLVALRKDEVTPDMKISIKALFNLRQILVDSMKNEHKSSFREYIENMDVPECEISKMVPIFKKRVRGPRGSATVYIFKEEEMSFYSFREHLKEEIKNTIMVSIRKAENVSRKLLDWKRQIPVFVEDRTNNFFQYNTNFGKSLNASQKESLQQEMTQIYTELFPEVIDSIASRVGSSDISKG